MERARTMMRRAMELDQERYTWPLNLGYTYLLAQQPDSAYALHETALARMMSEEDMQRPMADFDLFIEQGWAAEAARKAKAWIKERFAAVNGAVRAARAQRRQALAEADSLFRLGFAAYRTGNYDEAERLYLRALAIFKTTVGQSHPWGHQPQLPRRATPRAGAIQRSCAPLPACSGHPRGRSRRRPPSHGVALNNLAGLDYDVENHSQTAEGFERAASITESLREQFEGEVRRDYLATVVDTYRQLVSTRLHLGEPERALAAGWLAAEAAQVIGIIEAIVQIYRRLLVDARHPTRDIRSAQDSIHATARDDLARRFHDLLVAPIEEHLEGKTDLIIVTRGPLGFLPFETLLDGQGRDLGERFHLRHAPSANVWHTLRQRPAEDAEHQPLLAFGGAVYSTTARSASPDTARYENAVQVETAQRQAYAGLSRGDDQSGTYDALGYGTGGPTRHTHRGSGAG